MSCTVSVIMFWIVALIVSTEKDCDKGKWLKKVKILKKIPQLDPKIGLYWGVVESRTRVKFGNDTSTQQQFGVWAKCQRDYPNRIAKGTRLCWDLMSHDLALQWGIAIHNHRFSYHNITKTAQMSPSHYSNLILIWKSEEYGPAVIKAPLLPVYISEEV